MARLAQVLAVLLCAACAGCTAHVASDPPVTAPVTATPSPEQTHAEESPVQESATVTLTVVYDNNEPLPGAPAGLKTGWGFACLIETPESTVLFDTGGDGPTLLGNLDALGIDAHSIDAIILSHDHGDHTGGLDALLERSAPPVAWLPASFPDSCERRFPEATHIEHVTGPVEIAPGIRTLGEMGSAIVEQSITVDTPDGRVLVTGCAHPGIVKIARAAAGDDGLALAIGGFHLKDSSAAEAADVARSMGDLGLRRAAPTHCTGEGGRAAFRAAFGEMYVPVGLGSVLVFD